MTPLFIVSLITSVLLVAVFLPAVLTNQWLLYQDPFVVTQNPMVITGQPILSTCIMTKVWMPLTFLVYRFEFILFGLNSMAFHTVNLLVHVMGVLVLGFAASRFIPDPRFMLLGMLTYGLLPVHSSLIGEVAGLAELLTHLLMFCIIAAALKYKCRLKKRWLITLIISILLLFCVKPVMAMMGNLLLVLIAISCMAFMRLLKYFDNFLLTQERIILYLFRSLLVMAVMVLGLVAYERSLWWKNDVTLWSHVVHIKPSSNAYLQLAQAKRHLLVKPTLAEVNSIYQIYEKARTINPLDPLVYLSRADFAIRLKQADEAKKSFEALLKVLPDHPDGLMGIAQMALIDNHTSVVIDTLNHLITKYADNENVYLKVIALYGKAIGIYPSQKIYQEKREQLLADLDALSRRKGYSSNEFYNLALLYQQIGGKDEAIRYYQKALSLTPSHPLALYNLAGLLHGNGDDKAAVILYEKIIRLYPTKVGAYLNLGLINAANGDVARAKQMFLKTIDLDKKNSRAYFNLGFILENEGNLKEAMDDYERAIELEPDNIEAHYNLGNVYAKQGMLPEAIASYLKTVELDPKHINAYVNLSIIAYKSRDVKGAVSYLQKAKDLGYTPPEGYLRTLSPYMKK